MRKLLQLKACLQIIKDAPEDDKVMILSQWTSMLDIVSVYLDENQIPYLRFQGDMSRAERDKTVQHFNNHPKYRILLMSLKCGGVGLTLTGGNRAILLDLAWSPATESQGTVSHNLSRMRVMTFFPQPSIVFIGWDKARRCISND